MSETFENGPCVIVNKCNNEEIVKKVLNEPSVPFVGGPPEGEDNEAFVHDLDSTPQKNKGVGVNVKEDTILQTVSSPVLADIRNVPEGDHEEPSVLDLKEDEETKTAGSVTFGLYWNYFKQGLPVSSIMLLVVALLFAQGKVNSLQNLKILRGVPILGRHTMSV